MNNPLLIVLATMVLAWLSYRADATPYQQERQTESAGAGLALEVTYYQDRPPTYQPVIGHDTATWYGLFRHVPSWTPPADSLPVRAVNIHTGLEGDAVRIAVSVFLGERFHEEEKSVSTHLIHENEKIVIRELSRFGIEPFAVKVVRVTRDLTIYPKVTSQAGSIVVIDIAPKNSALPSYKVSLQNLYGKSVMALGVEVLVNGQKRLISMPQGKEGDPLIAPGAVYELNVLGVKDALLTSEGYEPNSPQAQEIVISAAMFDDNSYQGDAKTAARFRAFMTGRKIQVARLLTLMQTAADQTELDVSATVNMLNTQASSLSDNVETSVVDRLLEDFPTLSADVKESLKRGIEVSLHSVKTDLLKDLQKFVKPRSQSLDAQAFQTWLRVNKEKYERWLSRL
jgi:hypothetical protein